MIRPGCGTSRLYQARKDLPRGARDLVVRNVAHVLGEAPTMAKGVDDDAVSLAPKCVAKGVNDLGPGVDGSLPESVDVVREEVQRDRRATDRLRREHPISGNSSASFSGESPMQSSIDMNRPSGTGIRDRSTAPKTSRYQSAARAAPRTTTWGVSVWKPAGVVGIFSVTMISSS